MISFRDVSKVSTVIVTMSDYQTTIASAVEGQTATTAELNRSIAEAATGSEQIAESIGAVAAAARSTSESVDDSRQAAADLAEVSSRLEGLVGRFRFCPRSRPRREDATARRGPGMKLRRLGGVRA
ncbi:methyl-accepting chemotaxis protein [Nocardioides caldifontis]|uniref:methyl-accepting chemotaxis protein n=1 Tax=Nocardioides caldifontis TaxID=2588938 RepID=UPI0011DF3D60|nr:methyl-accepting chemotaxis protein [Nocardioides caldifontis]